MPYTSVQSNAVLTTQTILTSISGLTADRIKIGVYDQDPTDEFFQDLQANGYFVQIEPVKWGEYVIQEQLGAFDIPITFYFPIPTKENFQYLSEQDVVAAMRAALGTPNNWTNLPCPSSLAIEGPEWALDTDSPTGFYKLTISFTNAT